MIIAILCLTTLLTEPKRAFAYSNNGSPLWYSKPEWWLLGATVLTLLVIGWQAWETRRSAQAMRDAIPLQQKVADAALLNAQAVVNSERPWIAIFAIPEDGGYCFKASNLGRTPAEIVSFSSELKCVKKLSELPIVPIYETEYTPTIRLLVPGGQLGQADLRLLSSQKFIDHVSDCLQKMDTSFPVLYFRVVYKNSLSRTSEISSYESRTCFTCACRNSSSTLQVCGSEEYNRHT